MKERGMLFSAPMVRALLDGRKTQTRRVMKGQAPDGWHPTVGSYHPTKVDHHGEEYPGKEIFGASDEDFGAVCHHGAPGDRLWVREAWKLDAPEADVTYLADGATARILDERTTALPVFMQAGRKTSIHMPRLASRITLEITGVRVERVQDISEKDAKAEGVAPVTRNYKPENAPSYYVQPFQRLWDSINGKKPGRSWADNPWTWALEFKRIEQKEAAA